MAAPQLPQHAVNVAKREKALAREREVWQLDKSYHGLVFADADTVLRQIEMRWFHRIWRWFSWGSAIDALVNIGLIETLKFTWHKIQSSWNNLVARVLHAFDGMPETWFTRITRVIHRVNRKLTIRIWHPQAFDKTPDAWSQRQPLTEQQLNQTLPELKPPEAAKLWQDDWYFGWQRVAGQVPILLEWVDPDDAARLLDKLPITPERYADARPGDELAAATSEGRLFMVDMSILDGIGCGESFGWRTWMSPAVALFALTPDRSALMPVAIQCGQDPKETPYFTPADGEHWRWAKIHYQVAESNYHGVVEHGTLCHMLVCAIGVAAMRNLAPGHPIRVLLEPHLEHTLGVNIATKGLFAPGGLTTELQSVSLEGTVDLSSRAWKTFDWTQRSATHEFSRRGVNDTAVLPDYPFRDDSQLVTTAIRSFVVGYVDLYYPADADVKNDFELASWFEEVQSTDGPNAVEMPTVPTPETRSDLMTFLTDLLWRISPYHAVINYEVYNAMGFVPNTPTAAYAPPPDADAEYLSDDWLWLMPPQEGISAQIDDTWNVANTRMNTLGQYGHHFRDKRVGPFIEEFQANLRAIEIEINERNKSRRLPFTTLLPSNLTNSINV